LRFIAIVVIVVLTPSPASAQVAVAAAPGADGTEDASWQYGAFVDAAYLWDPDDPPNHLFRSRGTTFHLNEWNLNMAGAYVKKTSSTRSRWGIELAVHGGRDAEVFGFSPTAPNLAGADDLRYFGLANVSYRVPLESGLTLQAGIFTSLIGYDSLYAKDNSAYTRPWGADSTPYLMTGVNAKYSFTDRVSATLFVVNGYWHLADANHVPSSGAQLAVMAAPGFSIKQTVLTGPHQSDTSMRFWRFLSDSIVELRRARFTGALEYQVSTERIDAAAQARGWWMAAQLPLHWTSRGPWSLSIRPEIAWDSTGRWTGHEQSVRAMTTTLEYRRRAGPTQAILRLEHRLDSSRGRDGGFFTNRANDSELIALTPSQQLLILALMITFDSPATRP
jgi:hypothetical protein